MWSVRILLLFVGRGIWCGECIVRMEMRILDGRGSTKLVSFYFCSNAVARGQCQRSRGPCGRVLLYRTNGLAFAKVTLIAHNIYISKRTGLRTLR